MPKLKAIRERNRSLEKPHLFGKGRKVPEQFCFSYDSAGTHTWNRSLTNSCSMNSRGKKVVGNTSSTLAYRMEEEMLWRKKKKKLFFTYHTKWNSALDSHMALG